MAAAKRSSETGCVLDWCARVFEAQFSDAVPGNRPDNECFVTPVQLSFLQELSNREYEYLSLTRDTTEADIKQRREIREGTAFYVDLV